MSLRKSTVALALGISLPTLLTYNIGPSSGLPMQFMAVACWAALLAFAVRVQALSRLAWPGAAALGLLILGVMRAAWSGTPELAGAPLLVLLGAAIVFLAAAQGNPRESMDGVAWGMLLAGLAGTLIGLVQVFMPNLADGRWIASSVMPGRAVGNMRQPNHLATWLLLACVGLTWLSQTGRLSMRLALPALVALIGGIVLSASRSGLWIGIPLLALWGALDRKLHRTLRLALAMSPLIALGIWGLMHLWAATGQGVFWAEVRMDREGAGSPSRLRILRDAWSLLAMQPWAGVGWASFNRAWILTPNADRAAHFFDHSHNLPLQLLVELGWVHGMLILGLLAAALAGILRTAWTERRSAMSATPRWFAFMMLGVLIVHSMLEYPLWTPYFLLPCAFIAGLASASSADPGRVVMAWPARYPRLVGILLLLASAVATYEYRRVGQVFEESADERPLMLRIDDVIRSPIYGHHADYLAAVILQPSEQTLAAARRAARHFIDDRLLIAWAENLHANGLEEDARFLADRVREFRTPRAEAWVQECSAGSASWKCNASRQTFQWKHF